MDRRARVATPRGPLHAAVTIAVAAAVAVVLAFILVVVPLLDATSEIPDGLARAYAAYRDGTRRPFQQAQQDGAAMSRPACDPGLREPCADEHGPRTYITEVSVPDLGDRGIQRLHSRMLEPEPEAGR